MAARFGTVDGDLLLHNQTDSNSTTGFYEGTTGYYEGMFTVFSSINVPKFSTCTIMPNQQLCTYVMIVTTSLLYVKIQLFYLLA